MDDYLPYAAACEGCQGWPEQEAYRHSPSQPEAPLDHRCSSHTLATSKPYPAHPRSHVHNRSQLARTAANNHAITLFHLVIKYAIVFTGCFNLQERYLKREKFPNTNPMFHY